MVTPPSPPRRDVITVDFARPADLHTLRREVLRGGLPNAAISLPTDNDPEVFHLAATADDGLIVGCASFYPVVCSWRPDVTGAYQLRFMAVDPAHQGSGIGGLIMDRGLKELHERNVALLWANARDTALDFYLRLGFCAVEGSAFVTSDTDLPHTVVTLAL